jgi:hypothetical protein
MTTTPSLHDDERTLLYRLLELSQAKTTGTALASAARTVTTSSTDILTGGARAILVYYDITAVSGTGGLILTIKGLNPTSGTYFVGPAGATRTTVGAWTHSQGLGISSGGVVTNGNNSYVGFPLPDTIRLEVSHADASSYTYSVGYCLVY